MVRLPGRLPGQDAARYAAGHHRPLLGTVPPMEARTARRRLQPELLGRKGSLRERRPCNRRVRRYAQGYSDCLPEPRSEQGGCGVQRHHHGRLRYPGTRRSELEGVRALPHRPLEAHPAVRRPHHPSEGSAIPAQGPTSDFQGHSGGAVRGSARHPGNRRRGQDRVRQAG